MNLYLKNHGSAAALVRLEWEENRKMIHIMEPLENTEQAGHFLERVQEAVREQLGLGRAESWTWFLYGKTGTVGHYRAGGCYYVPLTDPRLFPAYISEMLIRINRNRMSG